MGHKAQGGLYIAYFIFLPLHSLHRHEAMGQSLGGSVKLGW
jgi:hypothetical protein